MANVDQRRINNQRSEFVGAAAAARLLEVKPATLYAYVSRGLLRSVAGPRGRAHRYALSDLRRLKQKRDARRGHAAVAAAALDFGEPVLDSALTRIDRHGPHYRGHSALALARAGTSFERACALLWQKEPAATDSSAATKLALERALLRLAALARKPRNLRPLVLLHALCLFAGIEDQDALGATGHAELERASALIRAMACSLGLPNGRELLQPQSAERAAELLCRALGVKRKAAAAIDQMLVLALDHELNVSTFAVRITASARADLYACVSAGLCALSGPLHGGMCDRVEALAHACGKPADARALIRERARLGEYVPGFGQPLYPQGDPRGSFLYARALALAPRAPRVLTLRAIAETMAESGHADPTLDFGLCALGAALDLPRGTAAALFALGRTGGWVAHALEQREQRVLLRPRARYVGEE